MTRSRPKRRANPSKIYERCSWFNAIQCGKNALARLGLTPRQHSSGGRDRLLGISKRGDAYLRSLLVHGARAMLRTAPRHDDPLSRWVPSSRREPIRTWPVW
nr:transposase [Dyella sp. C9]